MSDLREQIETAISGALDEHGSAWIDGQNRVRCWDCDAVVPVGGIGWHQIEMVADAVLKIIEPQEAQSGE